MEAERREVLLLEPLQELGLFLGRDEVLAVLEPGDERPRRQFTEQVERPAHAANSSAISDGLSSGASCSNVHWRGALSGRQRISAVPWRKRRPVTWS